VSPPCQRLEPAYGIATQVDDGLIVQLKSLAIERLAKVNFDLLPVLDFLIHGRLKESIRSAFARLDGVKREVCGHQKLVRIGAVLVPDRHADAGTGANTMAVDLIGLTNRFHEGGRECLERRARFDRCRHDGEFVAAEPGENVVLP
jgi:hypothetical protein